VGGSSDTGTFSTRQVWMVLAVVALVALAVLIGVWAGVDPEKDTLAYELAKSSLQVLGVAVVGAVIAIVTFAYQHNAEAIGKQAEREREDRQRMRDEATDLRGRQDAILRQWLHETLETYNSVKATRRQLDARKAGLGLAMYDEYMSKLMRDQLTFESLKKRAPTLRDERIAVGALETGYDEVEKYLNAGIDEYQRKRATAWNQLRCWSGRMSSTG
jgi:hypothetical protein